MTEADKLKALAAGLDMAEPQGLAGKLAKVASQHLTGKDIPDAQPRMIDQNAFLRELSLFVAWISYTMPSGRAAALGEPVDPEYAAEFSLTLAVALGDAAMKGAAKAVLEG